jgi:hypothetical protein
MADYPPLSRFYVASYAANDRDYPVVAIRLDPRTAGYKVPEDLSPHPDSKRYPNHVFTGSQPASGDQIVTHIYEILPAPWVPFTRYDDDLGPIQGRRRSVKNEGQVARLGPDQRVNYEAREGSAIVYTEIEEAWSIETDDDGNSLFPIRDRDFYDASRGAVQERRQLLVPTGEEEGTLENVNGVITQTSYEPYNEFLSVKIVQTYKVDGPLLIGKATDEARQLATVTTQRKGAADYVPPNPTATRTVEVSREDAESLVERVVEVPQVFGAEAYRKTREDITPQKFKAAQEDTVFEQTVEGSANPNIVLGAGEFVKSEEQVNKFTKRVATTSRSITSAVTLSEKVLTPQGQIGTRLLRLDVGDQSFTPSATLVDASVEALGDGRTVKTEVTVPSVFTSKTIRKTRLDLTPEKFRAAQADTIIEENLAGVISSPSAITLGAGEFFKSEEQVTEFVKRVSTNTRDISAAEILTETVITPQGQIATRTLRLTADPQSIQPDALLIDGSIEALGDQRTIKTEVRVPNVFDAKTLSASKPDVIPEKFRAKTPVKRTEEVLEKNQADEPSLGGDEFSKTEQRITEFKVQRTITTRENQLNEVDSQRLEENWGINIPYKEYISASIPEGPYIEVEGLSDSEHVVREYDAEKLNTTLSAFNVTIPTSIDLDVPRELNDIEVSWQEEASSASQEFDSTGLSGSFKSLTQEDKGYVSSSLTLVPRIEITFKEYWGKNLPAETHLFFLKKNQLTNAQIASKVGAIGKWPTFQLISFSTTVFGISETKSLTATISRAIQVNDTPAGYGYQPTSGNQVESSRRLIPVSVNIPPCLSSGINIDEDYSIEAEQINIILNYPNVTLSLAGGGSAQLAGPSINTPLSHSITAEVKFNVPESGGTTRTIPNSGKYIINSSVEPYKFEWFLVRATTFNASDLV